MADTEQTFAESLILYELTLPAVNEILIRIQQELARLGGLTGPVYIYSRIKPYYPTETDDAVTWQFLIDAGLL